MSLTLFAVKLVTWWEAIFSSWYGILWRWINSVSSLMIILAETLVQGRQIYTQTVYLNKIKILPLLIWKQSNVINMLPGSWLINLGNVPYVKLRAGVPSFCVGHSVIAIVRLTLVSGSPCCWAYAKPTLLPTWPLLMWAPNRAITWDGWGERLPDNHKTGHHSVYFIESLPCWDQSLMSLNIGHK